MTPLYAIGGAIAALLLVYLVVALLTPEKFS
jgi:K+-transporting ATPase KdpF subunit